MEIAHADTLTDVQAQLLAGRALVPRHVWPGIYHHVLQGVPTGNFLTGLFENDLLKATCGADETCLAAIADLARFMHNYAPESCWGSAEKVQRWRDRGGIAGGAHLVEDAG